MEPLHVIEYELTSEMATEMQQAMLRFEARRGWRPELPKFVGAAVCALLILVPVLAGWMAPLVGGGLLCLVALFILGAIFRHRLHAHAAASMAMIALHTPDRRVRVEFHEQRVRMETEYFRGEGAWTELDEIVIFPSFWALYLSNGGQIVIPSALASPELQEFLHAKAEEALAP